MYMPIPISIQPGIYTEDTETLSSERWIDGNLVRFWKGSPERWGGWDYYTPQQATVSGPARGGIAWRSLDGEPLIAFGTYDGLYVLYKGLVYDITPVDFVDGFENGLSVGGWGAGTWSGGAWGFAGSYDLYDSNGGRPLTWQLSTWGEDLIATARGQKMWQLVMADFQANPSSTVAVTITNAPVRNLGLFIHQGSRHLVGLGSTDILSNTDPLLVRWANQETLTTWTPAPTNTAGSLRCDAGNEIVGSVSVSGGRLILTDLSAHIFRYIGGQFVFSLTGQSYSAGMLAPHGAAEIDGVAYWMGKDRFHVYDGRVRDMPCDVHNYVYDDINLEQTHTIYCGTNLQYKEVLWFYPSSGSVDVDRCVALNVTDNTWTIHEIGRTTWIDRSVASIYPVATKTDGTIFKHEFGTTDETGAELPYRLESGDLMAEQPEPSAGITHLSLRKFVPDFKRYTGSHSLSIEVRDYPHRDPITKGPYTYNGTTAAFPIRMRGSRFRLKLYGEGDFRLGQPRMYATRNGARQQ